MYTLYYSAGACSKAVHIALNECGADYEAVCCNLHGGAPDKNLLAVNARHSVPVLSDNGYNIREGAAILTYLLDKERSELLPQSGTQRAAALEWLAWCNATLHPAYSNLFSVTRVSNDPQVQTAIATYWQGRVQKLWDDAEVQLSKNAYLAGDNATIADVLMTVIAQWQPAGLKVNFGPNTQRVLDAIKARPSWNAVTEAENAGKQQMAA